MSFSRRRFLQQSGASVGVLAGAGWLAPLPARGRADANSQLNIAQIGCGGRGSYLMNLVGAHQDTVISTVCDVNQDNLARAAEAVKKMQGKSPRAAADFRQVLDDPSIDAVIVATPHHWHAPIAVRALDAGKHVYCEKPASHVFREGRLIAEAARRNKRVVQHGTQMRSSEVTEAAGKVLASGVLGGIKQAKAWGVEPRAFPAPVPDSVPPPPLDYDFWLGPAPQRPFNANRFRRWNSFRDYGNGEVGGDGIHDIDMARWGLGVTTHPVRITAQGSRASLQGDGDYPDNMLVACQYDDGRVLIYENRNFAPYKMHGYDNGNVFYGTEGYMVFSRRGYFQTYLGADEERGPGMKGSAGVEQHIRNFLDAAKSDGPSNADAEVAHLSCGIVHLGEIAYRTGRAIQFDPDKEAVVGDDQAQAMLTKQHRHPWEFPAA